MRKFNKIIGEVILILPLFILSIFIDLWSECALIIMLLFVYKSMYKVNYHADNHIKCITLSYTAVALGLLIAYVFPKKYVLLIFIYNIIAYASACIGKMQMGEKKYLLIAEPYTKLVEFYNSKVNIKFNVDKCTEDELIERCKELRFSYENISLAIEFFIKKTPQKEIADRLCVDEKSVTTRKKRMKIKLNQGIDNRI